MERNPNVRLPQDGTSVVRLSSSSVECLEGKATDDSQLIGKFELNGKRSFLARGPALELINPTTGARQGSWRFRCDGQPTITAVCEASLESGKSLLVVGLSVDSGEGLVALFDPIQSRVFKVVKFPRTVTALESVGSLLEADEDASLGGIVSSFAGCVAVGTQGGCVYLLDIRADDDKEEFNEFNPSTIKIVPDNVQGHDHERYCAKSERKHLCVLLRPSDHARGSFKYFSSGSDRPAAHVYESDVYVSALKYIKVCNCLAVGYSIGGFQVFDLGQHKLVAGSNIEVKSPITHFTYLEPENDPLACFFLWSSSAASPKQGLPATLSMYQLFFSTKASRDDGSPFQYRNLTGMNCRFFHHLNSPSSHAPSSESGMTSRVISCVSLGENRRGGPRVPSEDDNMRIRDMTMMTVVWECSPNDHTATPDTFMGIFDINHWYNAQMPPEIRSSRSGGLPTACPYFTFFSLNPVLGSSPDAILHTAIDLSSLSRCSLGPRPLPDNFFWPSAVSFSAKCLTETSVIRCRFLSVQQEVLDDLCRQGAAALVDPTHLVGVCWQAGLLHNMLIDNPLMQDAQVQRNILLTIALQFNAPGFLASCATTLASGALSRSGITLRMLLDWAVSEIRSHKQVVDDLSLPLLDGSGQLSQQQLCAIDYHAMSLQHLTMLFRVLIDKAPSSTTQEGLKSLNDTYEACSLLSQHALTLVWLAAHKMLPEVNEPDDDDLGFVYPYETILQMHRQCMEKMSASGQSLMIDHLLERWQGPVNSIWGTAARGTGSYPPPNIHALLNIFFVIHQVPATLHSFVIYYLLLDIATVLPCRDEDTSSWMVLAQRYAQAFGMDSHAVSVVRGFWALDRQEFDLALRLLTEPQHTISLIPNQEHLILEAFLQAGQHKLAIIYLQRVPVSRSNQHHIHLSLDTLVANRLVAEAFEYQRRASAPGETDLFVHLLHTCEGHRLLHKLSHLPLRDEEEHVWVEFLEQSSSPAKKELLVVYYLQRARFVEAIRLNEKLQDVSDWEDAESRDRAIAREAIVQCYCKSLPLVQRQLAAEQAKPLTFRSKPSDKRPVPLSMTISQSSHQGKPLTEAHLISLAMDKITEARSQPVVEATPFKKRRQPGIQASPFIGTPRIHPHKSRTLDPVPLLSASPVCNIFEDEPPPLVDQSLDNLAAPGNMTWQASSSAAAGNSFMDLTSSVLQPVSLPMPAVRHVSPQKPATSVPLSPPRSPPRTEQEQAALLAHRQLPLSKLIGEEFHLATPPSVIGRPLISSRKFSKQGKSETPRRIRFADVEDDEEEEDRPDGLSEKPSQAMDTSTHAEESSFASKLAPHGILSGSAVAASTSAKLSSLSGAPHGDSDEEEEDVVPVPVQQSVNHVMDNEEEEDAEAFLSAEEDLTMSPTSSPVARVLTAVNVTRSSPLATGVSVTKSSLLSAVSTGSVPIGTSSSLAVATSSPLSRSQPAFSTTQSSPVVSNVSATTSSPLTTAGTSSPARITQPASPFAAVAIAPASSRSRHRSPRRTTALPTVGTPTTVATSASATAADSSFQFTPPNTRAKADASLLSSATRKAKPVVDGSRTPANIVFSPPWTRSRGSSRSGSRFLATPHTPTSTFTSQSPVVSTTDGTQDLPPPPVDAMEDDGTSLASEQSLFVDTVAVDTPASTTSTRTRRTRRSAAAKLPTEHTKVSELEQSKQPPASATPVKLIPDVPTTATATAAAVSAAKQKKLTRASLRSTGRSPAPTTPSSTSSSAAAPAMRMTLRRRNQDNIKPVSKR